MPYNITGQLKAQLETQKASNRLLLQEVADLKRTGAIRQERISQLLESNTMLLEDNTRLRADVYELTKALRPNSKPHFKV